MVAFRSFSQDAYVYLLLIDRSSRGLSHVVTLVRPF